MVVASRRRDGHGGSYQVAVLCLVWAFLLTTGPAVLGQAQQASVLRLRPVERGGQKVRGGRDGGSSVLVSSRSTRISGSHLTSLTKSASRQLLSEIRRKLDPRVPRRPRTFAKLVRKRTTSQVSYHAPLYGYALSRIKSTPHHHSHALRRRHARAKSLGLLSPPHSSTTIARRSHHHF